MKKEIEVWVNKDKTDFGSQSGTVWFGDEVVKRNKQYNYLKATLIIEETEPEITITPSRLREAFTLRWGKDKDYVLSEVSRELFGEDK